MKDGIYLNLYKDMGNLVLVEHGKLIDGDVVSIFDYNVQVSYKRNTVRLSFSELLYLGKL